MSLTVADIVVLAFAIVTVVLAIYMITEAWLGRNKPTADAPQLAEEEPANRPYDWETDGL